MRSIISILIFILSIGMLLISCSDSTEPETSVALPSFNPPGGTYSTAVSVTISCATQGAVIRYTIDGNDPTEQSSLYTEPIVVDRSKILKARGYKDNREPSQVATAHYTITDTLPAPELVFVEGGSFEVTDNYEVTLSSYRIGKFEVTQEEYEAVMGTNPSYFQNNPGNPVEKVSWFDAVEYCNRLSIKKNLTPVYSYSIYGTNPASWPPGWNTSSANSNNVNCDWSADGYRLPTEMEWEFAARGGVTALNGGTHNDQWAGTDVESELYEYAWYIANSEETTHPAGIKLPNELGQYDMSGNVWNWIWDIHGLYPGGSHTDPTGPTSGSRRIIRGGSWYDSANHCAVSHRNYLYPLTHNDNIGFRVCRIAL